MMLGMPNVHYTYNQCPTAIVHVLSCSFVCLFIIPLKVTFPRVNALPRDSLCTTISPPRLYSSATQRNRPN